MISILLATRNQDKATILTSLIENLAPRTSRLVFHTPLTERCSVVHSEFGSVMARAREKVISHTRCCGRAKDILIGSDDAFSIPDYFGDEVICDSEHVTDMILSGGLADQTSVFLVRSFWLVDVRSKGRAPKNTIRECLTKIPFRFLGHVKSHTSTASPRESYPLSRVLGRMTSEEPIGSENTSIADAYYAEHSFDLRTVLAQLLNGPSA